MQSNIVQAEFFHVGGGGTSSLGALFEECHSKISNGLELAQNESEFQSDIITAVRFFDESGVLTKIDQKLKKLTFQADKLLHDCIVANNANNLWLWWIGIKSRRLARQQIACREQIRVLAAEQLRDAIVDMRQVAVACSNRPFRLVKSEEAYELVELSERAKGAQIIVLTHNHLLADQNKLIAHAM